LLQSRRDRQAILDTDRRVTLLHAEGALRWHIGGPTIMAAQLEHLAELTHHPTLRLGVIPWDRPLTMHARHAFHLYDHASRPAARAASARRRSSHLVFA
ncbi:MAG: Scr1 family TA system antitoxin-like transcriptional regulator, partial [Pseudonocardiaceae bacterium]